MTEALAVRGQEIPLADTQTLGTLLARSGYFQDARDMAQAVVKVLAGRELGFGPIASMTGIYIVKGRVTLSANLMAARIKGSGKYTFRIKELTDTGCRILFRERVDGKWEDLTPESIFAHEDAKKAGLIGGDNWTKYPRNMYFARALSNGAKWHCADIFGGPVYTPDELDVAVDGETGEVKRPEDLAPAPAPSSTVQESAANNGAPVPSYEPFGAITMTTKMLTDGQTLSEALQAAFAPGVKSKTSLEAYQKSDPDDYRMCYEALHKKYTAWKDVHA